MLHVELLHGQRPLTTAHAQSVKDAKLDTVVVGIVMGLTEQDHGGTPSFGDRRLVVHEACIGLIPDPTDEGMPGQQHHRPDYVGAGSGAKHGRRDQPAPPDEIAPRRAG
jgi:hypothetical protein